MGPTTNPLPVLCVLIEVFSHAHAKGMGGWGGGAVVISSLALLLVIFQVTARQACQ